MCLEGEPEAWGGQADVPKRAKKKRRRSGKAKWEARNIYRELLVRASLQTFFCRRSPPAAPRPGHPHLRLRPVTPLRDGAFRDRCAFPSRPRQSSFIWGQKSAGKSAMLLSSIELSWSYSVGLPSMNEARPNLLRGQASAVHLGDCFHLRSTSFLLCDRMPSRQRAYGVAVTSIE